MRAPLLSGDESAPPSSSSPSSSSGAAAFDSADFDPPDSVVFRRARRALPSWRAAACHWLLLAATGALLGLLIDGLDAVLLGKKAGDTVTVSTKGAEGHEREELRGKAITITYTIGEAERISPRTTKELAEMFGVETEEIFREQVRDALEQRRDGEQRAAMREQVSEQLIEKVDFPLPSKLSEDQVTRTLEQQRMELLSRGMEPTAVENRLAELRGKSEKAAKDRLKLLFIMSRLAEHFGVQVTEQELNGRVAMMAGQQNMRPEQMRQQIEKSGRMNEVISMIRDAKVSDRIIGQAKVAEIAAEDWNKLVEARAKA